MNELTAKEILDYLKTYLMLSRDDLNNQEDITHNEYVGQGLILDDLLREVKTLRRVIENGTDEVADRVRDRYCKLTDTLKEINKKRLEEDG